jgi:competence protein ComEC
MRLFLIWFGFVVLLAFRYGDRFRHPDLEILFFDVGQGDSALVRFPGKTNLLVDGGGGFGDWDVGSREIFPELARLGVLTLDGILLSHPDQDHGYGLLGILKNLSVTELWYHPSPKPLLGQILRESELHHVRAHPVVTEEKKIIGGVALRFLPVGKRSRETNNRPLVMLLEYGACRAFFGGDMEEVAEAEITPHLSARQTLLKVSHHGSRTSSTEAFLQRAQPSAAVISVGRTNRYGHPHPTVLARLKKHGAQILRTDFHGFIRFRFRGDDTFECETSLGPCGRGPCIPR